MLPVELILSVHVTYQSHIINHCFSIYACRSVTECLSPNNVEELYLLAEIAQPDIRRNVCARVETKKQETNAGHSLHGQVPAERCLNRECFRSSVRHADFLAKVIRCSEWQHRQNLASHNCAVNLDESL